VWNRILHLGYIYIYIYRHTHGSAPKPIQPTILHNQPDPTSASSDPLLFPGSAPSPAPASIPAPAPDPTRLLFPSARGAQRHEGRARACAERGPRRAGAQRRARGLARCVAALLQGRARREKQLVGNKQDGPSCGGAHKCGEQEASAEMGWRRAQLVGATTALPESGESHARAAEARRAQGAPAARCLRRASGRAHRSKRRRSRRSACGRRPSAAIFF
jgi:hypothetical protein